MVNTLIPGLIDIMETQAPIRTYTTQQLADLYGMSVTTMRKWIHRVKDIGEKIGNIWNVEQVEKIFKHHGRPYVEIKTKNQ